MQNSTLKQVASFISLLSMLHTTLFFCKNLIHPTYGKIKDDPVSGWIAFKVCNKYDSSRHIAMDCNSLIIVLPFNMLKFNFWL